MKKEELNKTIEQEIEEINQQLTLLEDEKDKLIQLQTQLEMQKREEENKAWTERVIQARTKEQKRNLGRKNSKFGLLNKFKELRQIRKDKLDG
jgi:phage shock protein A